MATILAKSKDGKIALDRRGHMRDKQSVPFTDAEAQSLVAEKNRQAKDLGMKGTYLVGPDEIEFDDSGIYIKNVTA